MVYDFAIVGGGPAGLSAAIYASRFMMKTVVLASEIGGTVTRTHLIENWPGEKPISGYDLMEKVRAHAEQFGAEIRNSEVSGISRKGHNFALSTDGGEIEAKAVLLATGTEHKKLGVRGEEAFHGRGVSYCAVCDGAFFRDKTVAVIGGSDSAAKEALYLTEYAKKVFIIYRKEKIRAEPINAERVSKSAKIEIISNTNVTEIKGGKFVESVALDKPHAGKKELPVDGVFVEIGYEPKNALAKEIGAELDEKGDILVGCDCATSVPGVFAAGDITSKSFKQAITAAAQGVISANSAYQFIKGKKG